MPNLYASKGLPGSGKSTAARKMIERDPTIVRANRDDIRWMLYGTYWGPPIDENTVTFVQLSIIDAALNQGRDVYVDDTNLSSVAQNNIRMAATRVPGTKVIWHDFTDVPLCVCIERDDARAKAGERAVGAEVIRSMWERYLRG